jgi:hypothetical protein
MLCDELLQSGSPSLTPCQVMSARCSSSFNGTRSSARSTLRSTRQALSKLTNRWTSARLGTRVQSNQLVSLS